MSNLPSCPKCNSEYTYEDGLFIVCPECAFMWNLELEGENPLEEIIKDANGNRLNDGDDVIVIRDLRIKGSSDVIKIGTRVRNIKLVDGSQDGHDIDCRIDGFGNMKLKSEVVRKA